jgi:hypothetical protein
MISKRVWLACLLAGLSAIVCRAAEPVGYRLTNHLGRMVIQDTTGTIVPWTSYSLGPDGRQESWKLKHEGFIEAGVHLYQVLLWDWKGQYWSNPFYSMDGQSVVEPTNSISWPGMTQWLIEKDPQARFIMRFGTHPPPGWIKGHEDQYQILKPEQSGVLGSAKNYSVLPSLASDLYLETLERMIRDTVAWCERQPWRDRIVGYHVLPYCEGGTETAIYGNMFDTSPMMQKAFRAYLLRKYGTDEALRKAWGDETAALATAAVPTREEWFAKRSRLKLMHWPSPDKVQREKDYFLLQKELFHRFWSRVFTAMQEATAGRPVIRGYDVLKQHMQGWMHNAGFDGNQTASTLDDYNSIMLASGAIGGAPLLDHPGLDYLWNPGMYFNRALGYAWESEGLSDAMLLRGKVNYMEADMRTWVLRDSAGKPPPVRKPILDAGVFMTPAEMTAGFDRTLAWALSRNQMYYFASVSGGNWWFHDPLVLKLIARENRIIEASTRTPWADTRDAICLVIDDEASLYEDFSDGFQHLAVYRQLEEGLALCGVPYRIHLLADLARDNFPEYKCYLFPNLFKVDAEVDALLRRKIFRNGNVAIFGPATGITDGKTLTAAPASRLFNVPMELVTNSTQRRTISQDFGHPISKRLATLTFGDSHAYGPLLVPATQRLDTATSGATPLGATFFRYFFDRPGLFVTDFGKGGGGGVKGARGTNDYAVVFSAAVPLPPDLLRECARYGGCNVWSEENAVIYASGNMVALHTTRGGPHDIHLPAETEVWDLNKGERLYRKTSVIRAEAEPPATFLFGLGPSWKPGK